MQFLPKCIFISILAVSPCVSAASTPPPPEVEWIAIAGGVGYDQPTALATDRDGNVFVTGSFGGNSRFGATNLNSVLYRAAFLTKFRPDGTVQWARVVNTNLQTVASASDQGMAVSVDRFGNAFVAGESQAAVTITNVQYGTVYTNYPYSAFLAKFDPAGELVWLRQHGASLADVRARGVVTDKSGNVYLAGHFSGDVIFGITNLHDRGSGWYDVYALKYSSQGNLEWVVQGGGPGFDLVDALIMTADETLILAGSMGYLGWFQSYTNLYSTNFLARLDTNGNSFSFRALPYPTDGGIAVDKDANLYTGGYGTSPFSALIAKYDSSGTLLWTNRVTNTGMNTFNVRSHGLTVDGLGRLWVTFDFYGEGASFGTTNFPSIQDSDALIARYAPSGECEWAGRLGGWSSDGTASITTDPGGNIYWVGLFTSATASFGTVPVTNYSKWPDVYLADMFLVKLPPSIPKLGIATLNAGIALSWPLWADGFKLESKSLHINEPWSRVFASPVQANSLFELELSRDQVGKIFRLRSR